LSASELRLHPEAASRLATHFVSGFVRNPYDRALSAYRHHCRMHQRPADDFEDFLDRLSPAAIRFDWQLVHFSPHHRFFDEGDKCRADFIGRPERLAVDFRYLACRLGLDGGLGRENASDEASGHGPAAYVGQYTPRALLRVNDLCGEDFLLFGYRHARAQGPRRRAPGRHERAYPGGPRPVAAGARPVRRAPCETRPPVRAAREELQHARTQMDRLDAMAAGERQRADLLGRELAEARLHEATRLGELERRLHALEEAQAVARHEEARLRQLVEAGAAAAAELAYMKQSRSWRLTAPLRHSRAGGR